MSFAYFFQSDGLGVTSDEESKNVLLPSIPASFECVCTAIIFVNASISIAIIVIIEEK
jgi:hypothetical protein